MKRKSVTQVDIARMAGVSRSTVSLIINGRDKGRIPPETRERVMACIRESGYSPNLAARMLVRKSSSLIGLFTYEQFFPIEHDDFFYPFVLGVERAASRAGYNLLFFTRSDGTPSRGIYREDGSLLGLVSGTILMGRTPDENEIRRMVREGRHFVFIGHREFPGCEIDWVTSDYRSGARQAVEHLLKLGHKTLALVGMEVVDGPDAAGELFPGEIPPHPIAMRGRLEGCRDAVAGRPDVKLVTIERALARDGRTLVDELKRTGATAVVCSSNALLARVFCFAYSMGLRVPDDLSLTSLTDDSANLPDGVRPTGVHLNRVAVGEEAVNILVARMNGEPGPIHRDVPTGFHVGNTVSTPRLAGVHGDV